MSRHSIVGSGSLMTEDMYLKKYEATCLYEDPEQLNNHYRNTLKDMRCDKPFFESDMPRRDNYSKDRLNLRYGGRRDNTEPYMAEGSFIDYEFTLKDARGIVTDPDMKKYKLQSESRGKFIKYHNDEDNSVPSTGWNPIHVLKDIADQFYNVKSRIKIFDESKDGRHNGGVNKNELTSTAACLQDNDYKAPIMRDEMCYNRTGYLNDLSNNTSIGWRRTTDHVFQIAKYGQIRSNAPLSEQKWSKNRSNTFLDHDVLLSWQDQNIPKSLSIKMIDMSKKKYNDIENGKSAIFSEGRASQTCRTRKLNANDLSGMSSRESDETRMKDPNDLLRSERINYENIAPMFDDKLHDKSIIDPTIVEYIGAVNRKMAPYEMKDLREKIEQTNIKQGFLIQQKNKKCNEKKSNNETYWLSDANYNKGVSIKIANYAKISSKLQTEGGNQNNTDFERYYKKSKLNDQRRGKLLNTMYNMDVLDYDNEYGEEINRVQTLGHMGSKYTRKLVDNDKEVNYFMSDLTASN